MGDSSNVNEENTNRRNPSSFDETINEVIPAKRPPTCIKPSLHQPKSSTVGIAINCEQPSITEKAESIITLNQRVDLFLSKPKPNPLTNEATTKILNLVPAKRPPTRIKPTLYQPKPSSIPFESPAINEFPSLSIQNKCRSHLKNDDVLPLHAGSTGSYKAVRWAKQNELNRSTYENIPLVFKRLCYQYFTYGKCARGSFCTREHSIRQQIANKLKTLLYEELSDAYIYAKQRRKLYQETVIFFVNAFENLETSSDIIMCVHDILYCDIYNKTPFIQEILLSLNRLGINLSDAVYSIMNMDNGKNTSLSNIFLDIVCHHHKEDISDNWSVVQDLIQKRVEPVDHGLVEEIMTMCYQQNKIDLAKDIVHDILKPSVVDLKIINIDTVNSFLSMLHSCNLKKEKRILLERMNIYANFQSSTLQTCAKNEDNNQLGKLSTTKFPK